MSISEDDSDIAIPLWMMEEEGKNRHFFTLSLAARV